MRIPIFILVMCTVCVLVFSCYEPTEDCLDPDAFNYEVTADDACSSCCVLPTLSLSFSFLNNGEALSLGLGDSIRTTLFDHILLEDFSLIISNVLLHTSLNETISFEDSIRIFNNNELEYATDDFRYLTRTSFNSLLQGLRFSGFIDAVSFDIGLDSQINFYNKDSLDLLTSLNSVAEDDYSEGQGFTFYRFNITNPIDSVTTSFKTMNMYPLKSVLIDLNEPLEIIQGKNVEISLAIDFEVIFGGIQLSVMSENQILESIAQNLPSAFRLR